jgi:hypothetical protein
MAPELRAGHDARLEKAGNDAGLHQRRLAAAACAGDKDKGSARLGALYQRFRYFLYRAGAAEENIGVLEFKRHKTEERIARPGRRLEFFRLDAFVQQGAQMRFELLFKTVERGE